MSNTSISLATPDSALDGAQYNVSATIWNDSAVPQTVTCILQNGVVNPVTLGPATIPAGSFHTFNTTFIMTGTGQTVVCDSQIAGVFDSIASQHVAGIGASNATVSITPSAITHGNNVVVAVSGFLPSHSIHIAGGSWYTDQTTDSSGNGSWTIGPINDPTGSYSLTASDGTNSASTTYTVSQAAVYHSFHLSETGPGSVNSLPMLTSILDGTTVYLTATPDFGRMFIGWYNNGTLLSTSLTYQFIIVADMNIVGIFGQTASVTVTPTSIVQNKDTISLSVTGFKPSSSLSVYIVGGGGWNLTTDSNGSGTWSGLGPFGDSIGDHILRVTDGSSTVDTTITITATSHSGYSNLVITAVTSP